MMTITREQLELAAKAVGHTILYWSDPVGAVISEYPGEFGEYLWHPHTDPGDAARLAARMNMEINMDHGQVAATVGGWCDWARVKHDGSEPDKIRAWCEAVVKCAAAVGERMQLAQRTSATQGQVAGSLAAVDEYDAAKRGGG